MQIALIRCRLRERVISDPLLPFPVCPGTGGERHGRTFPGEARTRELDAAQEQMTVIDHLDASKNLAKWSSF